MSVMEEGSDVLTSSMLAENSSAESLLRIASRDMAGSESQEVVAWWNYGGGSAAI
jgi:hypothetical protein